MKNPFLKIKSWSGGGGDDGRGGGGRDLCSLSSVLYEKMANFGNLL